jgi:hypothetical protein
MLLLLILHDHPLRYSMTEDNQHQRYYKAYTALLIMMIHRLNRENQQRKGGLSTSGAR